MTVGRRPGLPVLVRTNVTRIAPRLVIIVLADCVVPSANRAKLTSMSPMTVAKVCRRNESSAH